jgi:H+-transporting ATPase
MALHSLRSIEKDLWATFADSSSVIQRVVKGAFSTIVSLAPVSATAGAAAKELEGQAFRVLAVACGPTGAMKMVGGSSP